MHSLTDRFSKKTIALICIILLLGFAAHSCMLAAPFKTLDDNVSIVSNPDIRSFANVGKIFSTSFFGGKHYYRPLVSVSFMIDYHLFGLRPFFYNLTNLILHLAVAVTAFFVILHILKDRAVAFFTALLFAVHPVHWEPVANIPGRAIILSTLFALNAFLFYCLAGERRRFVFCYGLSLLCFTCGLLAKESAAMLPILLLAYIFLVEKNAKKYPLVLPFFLIIGVYIFARRSLGIMETYPWRSVHEHVLGFLTFLRACLTYLRLFIWPAGLHFDRAQELFLSFRDQDLLATLLAFVAFVFALFKGRKRLPGYCFFFLAWFCIELFPVSQIVTTIGVGPGYISAAEHFLYMPSIGIFVLLVLGGRTLYRLNQEHQVFSVNTCRIFLAGAVLSLMLVTACQGFYARSALAMFERTLFHNPRNARILFSAGLEMVNRQRFKEAEYYFRRALEQEPTHVSYRLSLGIALCDQGKFAEGIIVFDTISDAGQWKELLETNRAEAYANVIQQYKKRIVREPDNAQAYYSLGTIYSRSGRTQEGIDQYERAVALDPQYKNALFNLASSYEALGREDQAVKYYKRVIALDGEKDYFDDQARRHLGEIYQRRGNAQKADEIKNLES